MNTTDTFRAAVQSLEKRFAGSPEVAEDDCAEAQLHRWLDAGDPLPWVNPRGVTPDEWFFVTTLYGSMTLSGQRTHIRRFFKPLFVEAAQRDIRNFRRNMPEFCGLRAPWMKERLCRMADVLQKSGFSMVQYVEMLRELETDGSPSNPQPAFDKIRQDLRAGEAKTLSVFVRDCVKGDAFPMDSRVRKELERHGLPADEKLLVNLSLSIDRNPRVVARMFYNAGGK